VVNENLLIFDPKEDAEPFFFHGSRQNCRDLNKKQNKELDFRFDRVFGHDSSNEAVFECSTKDIVKSLLDGYNCSGEYNSTSCVTVFYRFFDHSFHSNNISYSL
jgi:kinesin family protein 18/19